jgi:hypothetical protein
VLAEASASGRRAQELIESSGVEVLVRARHPAVSRLADEADVHLDEVVGVGGDEGVLPVK